MGEALAHAGCLGRSSPCFQASPGQEQAAELLPVPPIFSRSLGKIFRNCKKVVLEELQVIFQPRWFYDSAKTLVQLFPEGAEESGA